MLSPRGGQSGPDLASHRKKSQSGEALSSEIGVKADSWPPAGDGRRPMRSAGLMLDSDLEKNSKCQSTAIGDRGRCRLTVIESRPMRVATPDASAWAIGDRVTAMELGRAAAAGDRPPIAFRPEASMRLALPNRSESRPSQVMQALSERYRAISRDRCRRDAEAGMLSPRGGGRPIGVRSRIASQKSQKW